MRNCRRPCRNGRSRVCLGTVQSPAGDSTGVAPWSLNSDSGSRAVSFYSRVVQPRLGHASIPPAIMLMSWLPRGKTATAVTDWKGLGGSTQLPSQPSEWWSEREGVTTMMWWKPAQFSHLPRTTCSSLYYYSPSPTPTQPFPAPTGCGEFNVFTRIAIISIAKYHLSLLSRSYRHCQSLQWSSSRSSTKTISVTMASGNNNQTNSAKHHGIVPEHISSKVQKVIP